MRVCFISHSDSPWAPYYAHYMAGRGHEVDVVSFHPKEIPGVRVHYVGSHHRDGRLPKPLYVLRIPRVRRLLRALRPDVVMATYVKSNGLIGAAARCGPLVISTRGVDWEFPLPAPLANALVRWIAGRADALHASSAELAERLAALGVPRDRFTVIPLGTDPEVFLPAVGPRPAGPPRIICTRKHHPLYDNDTIVRALRLLRDDGREFHCRFVGTGSRLEETRRLAAELGLSSCIEFLGDREHAELPALLAWADLYVSSARSDGAPSSLFEAMSCGLFPVVTDMRANRDWLRHERDGFLFPAGDAEACAEGLRFAWDRTEVVAEAGRRNRQLVCERLDREVGLERLETLLSEVAEHRYRPASSEGESVPT
jgi:glycosyltransferase involved in cell wall biosynthesis